MTTLTDLVHLKDADARTDVRAEAHSHRHPKRLNLPVHGVQFRHPAWLAFLLLAFAVSAGGLFVIAYTAVASGSVTPGA